MAWVKSSPALIALFDGAVPDRPGVERRQMFGYPAAFANGQLFMGLHEQRFLLRLPDTARSELLAIGATAFEPMPGRSMREYVVLPATVVDDAALLKEWVGQALAHVTAMPPKPAKGQKRAGKR